MPLFLTLLTNQLSFDDTSADPAKHFFKRIELLLTTTVRIVCSALVYGASSLQQSIHAHPALASPSKTMKRILSALLAALVVASTAHAKAFPGMVYIVNVGADGELKFFPSNMQVRVQDTVVSLEATSGNEERGAGGQWNGNNVEEGILR